MDFSEKEILLSLENYDEVSIINEKENNNFKKEFSSHLKDILELSLLKDTIRNLINLQTRLHLQVTHLLFIINSYLYYKNF